MAEKINTKPFILHSDFKPSGDQPQAIEKLVENLEDGLAHQTLLGVTGSGKTFTIANVIATLNRPAMLLAPNKTLAAQLYAEMKAFFPENAVEYFVSYYDYYQPEAYVPSSDTFIEKDASINDQIEQMRLSATKSFLERRDTIVVASVSAIYGLGDPDSYLQMMLHLQQGAIIDQRQILAKLAELQYTRNDQAFQRGTFRVRGEVIDIFPAESDDRAVRIELFDDEIERLSLFDPLTGTSFGAVPRFTVYPKTHYVTPRERILDAIEKIKAELVQRREYFIKEQFDAIGGLEEYKEFVHFGLTSQDINNTAFPLMLKDSLENVYVPMLESVIGALEARADEWDTVHMLAKTHGQPASPTRLGKEVRVFVYRLQQQLAQLRACPISAKFGGATGNYNAHHVAYPEHDWAAFGDRFVSERLGLTRERFTTQISNYDNLAAVFDAMRRIHTILIDLDRDFWQYVSMEYFKQQIKAGEVGSSAMPHKVNPIDFENSEGNLGIANAILDHLSTKLPISRLQRDLTDSTVIRNIGVPMGHALIAFASTLKGLGKLLLREETLGHDLENNWAVCAEAIQTILRREGYPHPYEALKALTRTNAAITEQSISDFIDELNVSDAIKAELHRINPSNYTGI